MAKPKILALDIETKPITAYVWKLFDVNVAINQIADPGGILCVGAAFVGEKTYHFFSEWEHGQKEMLTRIHALMSEADAVITYNGDSFDLKKLNGQFLLHNIPPLGPTTSIDVLKTIKKMGFVSGKLAFVGPYLDIGKKLKTEGFELWTRVMNGEKKAQDRMTKYCLQDVFLLIKLYLRIKPYMINHPHLAETKANACGACGSKHLHSRGYRRTKAFSIQRLQCQSCGSWSDGTRTKV